MQKLCGLGLFVMAFNGKSWEANQVEKNIRCETSGTIMLSSILGRSWDGRGLGYSICTVSLTP